MSEQTTPEIDNNDETSDAFALDIDAALAAVTSLSDLVAEREAEETAERQQVEAEERAAQARVEWAESYVFPRPSLTHMKRGQLSSVIPALLLIVSGAYLTFALTLSAAPPAPGVVALIVLGVIGITLLSHWLSSGRWARGALFLGLSLLLTGAALFYLSLPTALSPAASWTLLIGALGVSVALSGLLAKPLSGRLVALGLGILVSAGFALAAALGFIPTFALTALQSAWMVVLPVAAVLMLLALVLRRRAA
jgi:hypothetical protein